MDQQKFVELLDSFHGARVLVMGDVMLDRFVYGSVHRISPEAPIPVLSVERTAHMPGGAANVARNVATLGAQVMLLGVSGDDAASQDLRNELLNVPSINTRLLVDPSRPTTVKTRHVADQQQILRADVESRMALSAELERELARAYGSALADADIVILSDYCKGVLSESLVQHAIAAAKAAGIPLVVDPKGHTFEKYRGATLLTPNRHELQIASGTECSSADQIVAAARSLLERDVCSAIAVTRGKDGMSIINSEGTAVHLRAVAREVFDVSGAGDTAVATMAIAMAVGGDIIDAAELANVAAGIVVGKLGTAAVTAGEIAATLEEGERALSSKQFTLDSVLQQVTRWRERGLRLAFANGCFDLLHPGHVSLLKQARDSADRLIVGLNSDLSVRRLKGPGRPVQSEVARATVLGSLAFVDAVVIFGEDTPVKLIEALRPDVLVKGSDYTVDKVAGADFVVSNGGRVLLVDLVNGYSTTKTLRGAATTNE